MSPLLPLPHNGPPRVTEITSQTNRRAATVRSNSTRTWTGQVQIFQSVRGRCKAAWQRSGVLCQMRAVSPTTRGCVSWSVSLNPQTCFCLSFLASPQRGATKSRTQNDGIFDSSELLSPTVTRHVQVWRASSMPTSARCEVG